jgi:hypothetical protein
MLFQELRDGECVFGVPGDAQGQRFDSLQNLKGVEGAQGRSQIPQQLNANLYDEGQVAGSRNVAKGVPEFQSVIAGIGVREFREFAVVPGKPSGIDDDASEAGPVSAQIFGGGQRHDVRAVINGFGQADADGVVHDERHAGVVGDGGEGLKIGDIQLGISDGLRIDRARFLGDGVAEGGRLAGVGRKTTLRPSLAKV